MKTGNTYRTLSYTSGMKNITYTDYSRLIDQIHCDIGNSSVPPNILHDLFLQLQQSKKHTSHEIPSDVITMNSKFIARSLNNNKEQEIKIVYPIDAINPGEVPIYDPLALSCIGCSEKSKVEYYDGHRLCCIKIEKITFQPEKSGLYEL